MYVSKSSPFIWILIKSKVACSVTIRRTRSHTCLHLALLCICDTCALDAADQDPLMARYGLLFMVIVAFCLYDTRCVDNDRYYTRSIMVCICVGPQEMMSSDVITGQWLYDKRGVESLEE
jgi:hypothetical protein